MSATQYPLSLDNALNSWRHWPNSRDRRPHVIGTMKGGLTNTSIRIRRGEDDLVLRLHALHSHTLGIRREHERKILMALSNLDIAPKIVYWDPKHRFSVFEYIDGRVWRDVDFIDPKQHAALQKLIASYQNIDVNLPAFNYRMYLHTYHRRLGRRIFLSVQDKQRWMCFIKRLSLLENTFSARALTHHDLNPSNIIDTGKGLKIIDWEYAGYGIKDFDYRFVHYLGHKLKSKPSIEKRTKSDTYVQLFTHLDRLWWQVHAAAKDFSAKTAKSGYLRNGRV